MASSRLNPRRWSVEKVVSIFGVIGIGSIFFYQGYVYFFPSNKPTDIIGKQVSEAVSDEHFLTYADVQEKIKSQSTKVILIDIRDNSSFSAEHIPQSTNIPFEALEGLSLKEGFTFILITESGNEQGIGVAAFQSLQSRFSQASLYILRGGFEGWKTSSGQTISFGYPDSIEDQSKVNYILPEEAKKKFDAGQKHLIIDMRPKDVYDKGHIQSAINLPFDQLEALYQKIPTGYKIIAYGNSELEDFQVGVRMFDLGFFSTEVLKGGYEAWKNQGYEGSTPITSEKK
jgi:rhodanese-related sulfurtransferase